MIGCIVQARMGSTRLPGKVLMDLGGKPVLRHVLERVAAVPSIRRIVVATSREPQDDIIDRTCEEWGYPCYRGSEQDVLDRFYRAAALSQLTAVVRITADCPLLDPMVTERVVQQFLRSGADYASNVHPPTFPDGLDCEVIKIDALEEAWDEAGDSFSREHVTPFVWKQPDRYRMVNVESTGNYSDLRWTVDTREDLEQARQLYAQSSGLMDYRVLLPR